MSNYNYFQKTQKEEKKKIHPVWSGIGCLMTVLTPIISWAAAQVLIDYGKTNNWLFLNGLSAPVRFPASIYHVPVISGIANYISTIPYFEALFVFFILFLFAFSSIFSILNAFLYRRFGPPRFSAIDAPPPPKKGKRYTR